MVHRLTRWLVTILAFVTTLVWLTGEASLAHSQVPDRPTGLTPTAIAHNAVALSWDDPEDESITHYQVLRRDRDTDAPGVFAVIEEDTGSADTGYIDETVVPLKRYVYRVVAVNAAGASPRSSYINVDTPDGPPRPAPARPTGLTARSVAYNSVDLNWDDPGDRSITHYQILRRDRDSDAPGVFAAIQEDTGSADAGYSDETAEPLKRYVYRVVAVNAGGASPRSSYVNVNPPAAPRPARPTGLAAPLLTHDAVRLTWDDPKEGLTTGYRILRRDRDVDPSDLALVVDWNTGSPHTHYTDETAEPLKRYAYLVVALSERGASLPSAQVNVDTPAEPGALPLELPSRPTNLRVKPNDDGTITLTWDAPDDDTITGYQIVRRHPSEDEGVMVESVIYTGSTATTYTDDGLKLDVLHGYAVRATNARGLGERSNFDNATPHVMVPLDFGLGAFTVYLTFDDGPRVPYTAQILDLLERYGARVTFFVTGLNAALHPDLIARMAAEGHGVGNHTWQHERLTRLTQEQFNGTVGRTQDQLGAYATRCLRPPYGSTNGRVGAWVISMGLQQVMWTIDSKDFLSRNVERIVARLSERVSHRAVVLLHDGGAAGGTVEVVARLLEYWSRLGYQFKPICEPPAGADRPPNLPASGRPAIRGVPRVGSTLTADAAAIVDGDGLANASFSYQWLADNAAITGATGSSYRIAARDEGKTIMVRVTFTDDAGNTELLTSAPTRPVAEAVPPSGSPGAPQHLSVTATEGGGELAVSWTPPGDNGGLAVTGYQVEWKLASGHWGQPSDVTEGSSPGTSYTIMGLAEGSLYAIRVRALNQTGAGSASGEELAAPLGLAPLRAEFQSLPASHLGTEPFTLRVAFNESIGGGYMALRDSSLDVIGGIVLTAGRVDGRDDLWSIVILPDGSGPVTIILPVARECSTSGAICTPDGKGLSHRLEGTVQGASAPATGRSVIADPVQEGKRVESDTQVTSKQH